MSKLLDITFKLTSLGLIFVAPIVYLIWKYNKTTTQVVEVTDNSMPILIVIILSIFVMMVVSYIFSQTMQYIKDSPFGYGSIFFFGGLTGGVVFVAIMWIDKIANLINYNVVQFTEDLQTYKSSMWVILIYILSGLIIGTTGIVIKKTA